MKQLVEFVLPDKSSIFVEVEEPPELGPEPMARPLPGKVAIQAKKTFSEALDSLNPMFSAIKQKFNEMSEPADEVEVKFGLKLSGQCGAIITAGAEASYEITLRWNKK